MAVVKLKQRTKVRTNTSLIGKQGPIGEHGVQGPQGPAGKDGLQGPQGPVGAQGTPGKDGAQGIEGKPGKDGLRGPEGLPGKDSSPKDVAALLKADEDFLRKTKGKTGESPVIMGGGGHATATYTAVTSAEHVIGKSNLVHGMNIIGVNYAGAVNIYLPHKIDPEMIIVINDESGSASSNNITVTTR